jgi:nitrite reductase (cytochrome c-552)
VPMVVDLELNKYLDGRGDKKLNFQKEAEFKDPFGNQDRFMMINLSK